MFGIGNTTEEKAGFASLVREAQYALSHAEAGCEALEAQKEELKAQSKEIWEPGMDTDGVT